ncbi:MAG: hypothetical protein NC924_01520, partial [Candidatus Omnitrophica bacterium]|nr:hypothetical protein [Candidatus Omnitrophota bacterium]
MKKLWILVSAVIAVAMCAPAFAEDMASVQSKYPITVYGLVKVDMSYDDSTTNNGNVAYWVVNEGATGAAKDAPAFNLGAKDTRLGLKIKGPDYEDVETNGLIEFDFLSPGGGENTSEMRTRHLYVNMVFPDSDFNVLVGQTWDVVMPQIPTMFNYTVMWYGGNVGYRRPQVRLGKGIALSDDTKLMLQAALTRPIGDAQATNGLINDTGEDSGLPGFQARAAVTMPLLAEKKATIGLNAAMGKETRNPETATEKDYDVNLFGIDVNVPVADKIALKGEYWTGENVDEFLGGIGNGTNTTLLKSIEASGYWIGVDFGPFESWKFALAYGVDDPDAADLANDSRDKNTTYLVNTRYAFSEAVNFG